jgi:hypothetical protein
LTVCEKEPEGSPERRPVDLQMIETMNQLDRTTKRRLNKFGELMEIFLFVEKSVTTNK